MEVASVQRMEGGGGGCVPPTPLYVGDLEENVNEPQLFALFGQIGHVVSLRVCRQAKSAKSLGYGYINYEHAADVERAIELLNYTPLNGKAIRIMYSNRDLSSRQNVAANIFIKNLPKDLSHRALHDKFSVYGSILSCKIATDASGCSKGYGFVQFDREEAAQCAIENINGVLMNGKQLYVQPFLSKQIRENAVKNETFTNVYVKNLSETTTEDDLRRIFSKFGVITSVVVMRNEGKSECFGFVNFENADAAAKSVSLNGKKNGETVWYVSKAQKKSEREVELKKKFEKVNLSADEHQGKKLYLKNLDDSINDDTLRGLFSGFGIVISSKVMCDPRGVSKGSGFVSFSTADEASRAFGEMNGKMVAGKPLYVALAQRKEARKATLQQQLVYGTRPCGAQINNCFAPMVQQEQLGDFPVTWHSKIESLHQGNRISMLQHQLCPWGRPYRHTPGSISPDATILCPQYRMRGLPIGEPAMQTVPIGALASALATAPPDQRRAMLGESLYPLVEQLEHGMAAKVTGMLLEMDQTDVLHLLESPQLLKIKVAEAMEVLRSTSPKHGALTDQLSVLSLRDGIVI